jgi:hypothetical protein
MFVATLAAVLLMRALDMIETCFRWQNSRQMQMVPTLLARRRHGRPGW